MARLRDYVYLDSVRIMDYLSAFDPGQAQGLREVVRMAEESSRMPADLGAVPRPGTNTDTTHELTLNITARHSFSRLYDLVAEDGLSEYQRVRDMPPDVPRNKVVEVSGNFEISPLNQMIDSILGIIDMMGQLEMTESFADAESQQIIRMISVLFARGGSERMVDMLHRGDAGASILFSMEPQYVVRSTDDVRGGLTVFGKIQRVVPAGETVDLFDVFKVLPRAVRRVSGSSELRDAFVNMFERWPDQLGGPVSADALTIAGPAYVISPAAVYE